MKRRLAICMLAICVASSTLYVSAAPPQNEAESGIESVISGENEEDTQDDSDTISNEESEEANDTDSEEVSETDSEEVSETDSEEVSETDSEEVSEQDSEIESETDSEEDSEKEKTTEITEDEDDSEKASEKTSKKTSEDTSELEEEELEEDLLEETWGNYDYTIYTPWSGDKYVIINKYNGFDSKVTIPSTISGIKVTEIAGSAFEGKSTIETLTIPASVKKIGSSAFYNCSSLTKLTLNEGLETISDQAFCNCVSLKSVVIPSTVKEVGGYWGGAFENCSSLSSVTIKGSAIGYNMFKKCINLTSVKIPSTVTDIGDSAFYGCVGLRNVVIEATGKVGSNAFQDCLYLDNLSLKNVTGIDSEAFRNTGIKSLACPSTLTYISENVFYDCQSLASVSFNNGLKEIYDGAFCNCISIKQIVIPATVTRLSDDSTWGEGAFQDCTGLTTLTVNGTHIGAETFLGCTSLAQVTIPRSVSYIGHYAFYGCTGLKKATINSSGEICEHVFEGCSQLADVTLQNGLFSTIGEKAFYNTPIKSVSLPKTVTAIGTQAFGDCTSLSKLTLNTGLLTLNAGAFSGCTALTTVTIPITVTNIYSNTWYGGGAFENCTSLRDVTIKSTIVGERMFYGCKSIQSIVFPANVNTINSQAFYNCSKLNGAMFLGNAPGNFGDNVFDYVGGGFTIQYLQGRTGWTSPTWKGYATKAVKKYLGDVCGIFIDVQPSDWYVSAVQYVYDRDIMSGKSTTEFGANSPIKREDVAQLLYNYEGKPTVSGKSPFSDVANKAGYPRDAIMWANQKNIVTGKPGGTFGLGNNITRQDFAQILYKYAKYKKFKTTKKDTAINAFSDASKVSPYAKDAMNWAVSQGIMSGKNGELKPAANASRAECASMIMKLLKNNGK